MSNLSCRLGARASTRAVLVTLILHGITLAADPPTCLDSGIAPDQVESKPYIDYVKQAVDLLIAHGTDRYGKVRSPILMNILDVRSRECPANPLALDEKWRVTRRGRRGPGGANLYTDQPTIRAMVALGKLMGDAKYQGFVNRSLDYYVNNLVDDKGMFWWGFHRHYDAHTDTKTGHSGNHHEIHIQMAAWPLLWAVDADAVRREIEGCWQWHVIDKKTGEINRHADGRRGCDFAMTGGEILLAFAFLHTKTGDAVWLDRAKLLATYYWDRREPTTNLVPNRPNAGRDRFDGSHFDTSIAGLMSSRLLRAYELTGETCFRDQAVAYLKAYNKYTWDPDAHAFYGSLNLDGSPVKGPRIASGYAQYEPRGHIDMWEPYIAGYECPIYAAQAYAYAYQLTKDPELLTAAKHWSDAIRRAWPPRGANPNTWYAEYAKHWAIHGTYAGLYGRIISFHLHLAELTGDKAHVAFAREVAREAVSKLYYKGMFRGHPAKPYHEAVDGVGYLLVGLLQLDQVRKTGEVGAIGYGNW